MHIWMINHYASTPQYALGTRHYSLARKLKAQGHHVTVIASSFCHLTRKNTAAGQSGHVHQQTIDGVEFIRLSTPGYSSNGIARFIDMLCFLFRLLTTRGLRNCDAPDVVIGSSPHLLAALGAQQLAASMNVPFVLEIRDIWPMTLVELGRMSRYHPLVLLFGAVEKFLYRKADKIITLLPGAAEHICSRGGSADRIVWIPNGVDLDMLPPVVARESEEIFKVMYTGAHGVANRLATLIDASILLDQRVTTRPVIFQIVGDGPEKDSLKKYALERGAKSVQFLDPVKKRDIYDLLATADVCVVHLMKTPLFRHGVSMNKLFDYLGAGRPTIFAVEAYNNPVEDAGAGVSIDPENPQQMADAINHLLGLSQTERDEMGLRGRRLIEDQYNLDRHGALLETALYSVCSPGDTWRQASSKAA